MESLTSNDGVGAIAISGAHFQKVKGKADHEPVLKQLGHHTVVDIDENRYVTLDTRHRGWNLLPVVFFVRTLYQQ